MRSDIENDQNLDSEDFKGRCAGSFFAKNPDFKLSNEEIEKLTYSVAFLSALSKTNYQPIDRSFREVLKLLVRGQLS